MPKQNHEGSPEPDIELGTLEFYIEGPIFTEWSWLSNASWCKISLRENGKEMHILHIAVNSEGLYMKQIWPAFEKLKQMFLSTTRGLPA